MRSTSFTTTKLTTVLPDYAIISAISITPVLAARGTGRRRRDGIQRPSERSGGGRLKYIRESKTVVRQQIVL